MTSKGQNSKTPESRAPLPAISPGKDPGPDQEPVSAIRNLGPESVKAFARAGITTASELRALGADEAYARLLATGQRPHFIGYYVLVMGLQGRPWNDCKGKEKDALRKRFDSLKAAAQKRPEALPDGLARFLRDIGLD